MEAIGGFERDHHDQGEDQQRKGQCGSRIQMAEHGVILQSHIIRQVISDADRRPTPTRRQRGLTDRCTDVLQENECDVTARQSRLTKQGPHILACGPYSSLIRG